MAAAGGREGGGSKPRTPHHLQRHTTRACKPPPTDYSATDRSVQRQWQPTPDSQIETMTAHDTSAHIIRPSPVSRADTCDEPHRIPAALAAAQPMPAMAPPNMARRIMVRIRKPFSLPSALSM